MQRLRILNKYSHKVVKSEYFYSFSCVYINNTYFNIDILNSLNRKSLLKFLNLL